MSSMIWNFVIIFAIVVIFIILARRLPVASQYQKKEKEDYPKEKVVAYSLMAQADEAFEQKKYDSAEELYIKIAAKEPKNAKVYNRLGLIYLVQQNYYDAKDAFLQSIKLEPGNIDIESDLGHAYMGLKDYFKASQAYMKAVEAEPKNHKYREFYGRAQKALGREKKKNSRR